MRWLFSFLLLSLMSAVRALSVTGQRVLVVLEDLSEEKQYNQFWADLEERGFNLNFQSPKNDTLSLFKHGERAFDHLILFPPKSKAYGPSLAPKILLDFLNKAGNILLTLSANTPIPTAIQSLLLELDIHLPSDRNALVVDHFNYDSASAADKHDVILTTSPSSLRSDVKNYFSVNGHIAVPRAVGQVLGNASPLLTPILRAPSTAYSYNPKDDSESIEDLFAAGQQLSLVSALQARNSGRFTVLGSSEILLDTWFAAKLKDKEGKAVRNANRDFIEALTAWTFHEIGVLQVGRLEHQLTLPGSLRNSTSVQSNTELSPKIYRVKNDVTFTIELSEYSLNRFIPFYLPDSDALQLEFTMLSPYHRLSLVPIAHTPNSTIFRTHFTLPDQHGIFNFRVNYKRPFLSNIDEKRQVTVRHFAHDEWPRSWAISAAWVWMAGIAAVVVGWVGFVGLWLWSEPTDRVARGKKTQ